MRERVNKADLDGTARLHVIFILEYAQAEYVLVIISHNVYRSQGLGKDILLSELDRTECKFAFQFSSSNFIWRSRVDELQFSLSRSSTNDMTLAR